MSNSPLVQTFGPNAVNETYYFHDQNEFNNVIRGGGPITPDRSRWGEATITIERDENDVLPYCRISYFDTHGSQHRFYAYVHIMRMTLTCPTAPIPAAAPTRPPTPFEARFGRGFTGKLYFHDRNEMPTVIQQHKSLTHHPWQSVYVELNQDDDTSLPYFDAYFPDGDQEYVCLHIHTLHASPALQAAPPPTPEPEPDADAPRKVDVMDITRGFCR